MLFKNLILGNAFRECRFPSFFTRPFCNINKLKSLGWVKTDTQKVIAVPTDVTHAVACQELIKRAIAVFGQIDIFILGSDRRCGRAEHRHTHHPSSLTHSKHRLRNVAAAL
ncbi:hypothetical protein CDG77_19925 [Nostoc sp. 'Peltigera membranacea cyanobiont' 213]|nr:hypothetical protein CDG77_19925 [Nostoc sp. 'Peltigera membranacea cyanobiont' 213]